MDSACTRKRGGRCHHRLTTLGMPRTRGPPAASSGGPVIPTPPSTADPAGARPVAPAEAAVVITVVAAVTVLGALQRPIPPGADPARGRRGPAARRPSRGPAAGRRRRARRRHRRRSRVSRRAAEPMELTRLPGWLRTAKGRRTFATLARQAAAGKLPVSPYAAGWVTPGPAWPHSAGQHGGRGERSGARPQLPRGQRLHAYRARGGCFGSKTLGGVLGWGRTSGSVGGSEQRLSTVLGST